MTPEKVNATGAQCIGHPTYDVIDLSAYDPDLRGFAGGLLEASTVTWHRTKINW